MTGNCQKKNGSLNRDLLNFLYMVNTGIQAVYIYIYISIEFEPKKLPGWGAAWGTPSVPVLPVGHRNAPPSLSSTFHHHH